MSTFKARGIILKEIIVNDKDKSLNILFKDIGKLNVWVKNSTSPKNKLFYGSKTFSYADFIIYDNGKNLSLNQIDLIENFYSLTTNLDKLAYGTYFLEIVDKVALDNTPCNDLALLLLKALSTLSKDTPIHTKLIAKIFDLKLLQLSGYMPNTSSCIYCNKDISNFKNFHFAPEGLICENCINITNTKENLIEIEPKVIHIMNYIFNSDLDKLFSFNTSKKILENLSLVSRNLIDYNFYFNLKSKIFIKKLEDM